MGMSLAYAIAQRVGGHMDIESQPGQGTTVSLTLPIAVADPAIEIDPKFN
jgi:two-component system sensor histidine kinase EvgS